MNHAAIKIQHNSISTVVSKSPMNGSIYRQVNSIGSRIYFRVPVWFLAVFSSAEIPDKGYENSNSIVNMKN